MKWNFPVMGEIYIQILEEYVTSSTVENLKDQCSKVPSFAGFWYESLFFMHHKQQKTSGLTICCNTKKTLQFCIEGVLQQETVDAIVQRNMLYELRTSHPIVDALGYLREADGMYWLVFIQISLQRYEAHGSLCDIFKRAPKNLKVPRNVSLFTYYKHLFGIGSNFQNILLLYVSPTAKDVNSLSKLNQQISELSNENLKENLKHSVLSDGFQTDENVKSCFH